MTSATLRTFAFLLIAVAVVFGALAYYMNRGIDSGPDAAANAALPETNAMLAVVALKPLSAYVAVAKEDVSLVPISVEPPQYFTDLKDVVGRTPVREVAVGAPVTEEAFGRGSALSEAIPPGTLAMSLSISDVIAVGGFVKPGDFVDVLMYLRSSGDQVEDSQARILLKKARVLAYQEQLISGSADKDTPITTRRERTAVLAIPEAQITRVMLGASLGELRLALRAPDLRSKAKEGANEVVMASTDSAVVGEPPMPASVSPAASRSSVLIASEATPSPVGSEPLSQQQVITLKELAGIEKKPVGEKTVEKKAAPVRRRSSAPQSAIIELYEGSKSSRISRSY